MAIGPISYTTGADSPLKAFNDAFSVGQNMQQAAMQNAQQQVALQQSQSFRSDAATVAADPTPTNIAQLMTKYPEYSDKLKAGFDAQNTAQQSERLNVAVPIYSAVLSGKPEIAASMLNKQADGYEAAGDKKNAASARMMAKLASDHPEQAKTLMGAFLASVMGPDKFAETFSKLGGEARASELAPAEKAKANAEAATAVTTAQEAPAQQAAATEEATAKAATATARASTAEAQAQADLAKTQQETEASKVEATAKVAELQNKYGAPTTAGEKIINDSVEKSVGADKVATSFNDFANKIELQSTWGPDALANKGYKAVATLVGGNDEWTNLLNEYSRMRTTGILEGIPKNSGTLSDNDIKIFSAGIPKDTDSPQRIAAWLRSMATVKKVEALEEDAKAQWVAANQQGGLGPAKKDLVINGVVAPQGLPFPKFRNAYIANMMKQHAKDTATGRVNSRSYMQYVQP